MKVSYLGGVFLIVTKWPTHLAFSITRNGVSVVPSTSFYRSGSRSNLYADIAPISNALESSQNPVTEMNVDEIKGRLLSILPNMNGKNMEENMLVEDLINDLEGSYKNSPLSQIQTVAFFNIAIGGEWELAMTTNMLTKTKIDDMDDFMEWKLSLVSPVRQNIDTNSQSLVNTVQWKLTNEDNSDELLGSLSSSNKYELVNQSTRLFLSLGGHSLKNKSKRVPTNDEINMIVEKLIDEMTIELFDPNGLSIDTTFVDEDVRIIRYTSANGRSEGVRNIFLRKTQED